MKGVRPLLGQGQAELGAMVAHYVSTTYRKLREEITTPVALARNERWWRENMSEIRGFVPLGTCEAAGCNRIGEELVLWRRDEWTVACTEHSEAVHREIRALFPGFYDKFWELVNGG